MRGMKSQFTTHPVILVVEDMESLRQTMLEILEDAEYLVLPAANAGQALELAQSCAGPINLLITTRHPDGMPGPDLAFCLRKRSPEMRFLYSSAHPLAVLEIQTLPKPFLPCFPGPSAKQRFL